MDTSDDTIFSECDVQKIGDIIPAAIEQKRDLRFWHDAVRVTLSPYIFGLTGDGDAIVAGVTSAGRCLSVRMSDMVGVEMVVRRPHPPTSWNADNIAEPIVTVPRPA